MDNNEEDIEITFDQIGEQDLFLIWIGYVDIKNFLPKYHNSHNYLEKYVLRCIDYFGKDMYDGRLFQVFFFNTER